MTPSQRNPRFSGPQFSGPPSQGYPPPSSQGYVQAPISQGPPYQESGWGDRAKNILWRFRFSISSLILYSVFQWGFAHMSFSQGFFETSENPNYVVMALGDLTIFMRFDVMFAVPAHITYRVVELVFELVLSLRRPKAPPMSVPSRRL